MELNQLRVSELNGTVFAELFVVVSTELFALLEPVCLPGHCSIAKSDK